MVTLPLHLPFEVLVMMEVQSFFVAAIRGGVHSPEENGEIKRNPPSSPPCFPPFQKYIQSRELGTSVVLSVADLSDLCDIDSDVETYLILWLLG